MFIHEPHRSRSSARAATPRSFAFWEEGLSCLRELTLPSIPLSGAYPQNDLALQPLNTQIPKSLLRSIQLPQVSSNVIMHLPAIVTGSWLQNAPTRLSAYLATRVAHYCNCLRSFFSEKTPELTEDALEGPRNYPASNNTILCYSLIIPDVR